MLIVVAGEDCMHDHCGFVTCVLSGGEEQGTCSELVLHCTTGSGAPPYLAAAVSSLASCTGQLYRRAGYIDGEVNLASWRF